MNTHEWIVATLLTMVLAIGIAAVIVTVHAVRTVATEPCKAPGRGWEPPDLSRCPADMAMWDCMRDASYRSDI